LANVCDPNYTSVAKIAKDYLPAAGAMNGAHARLSAIARSYRGS
jgi:amidase